MNAVIEEAKKPFCWHVVTCEYCGEISKNIHLANAKEQTEKNKLQEENEKLKKEIKDLQGRLEVVG